MNTDCEYEKDIIFFFYAIENNIISKDEIIEWADSEILKKVSPSSFIIELSLSESLDEQFGILDEKIHRNDINYKELNFQHVLYQIKKYYSNKETTLDVINKIFHTKDALVLRDIILKDIYNLDNSKDLYLSGIISFDELEKRLNIFFSKYID